MATTEADPGPSKAEFIGIRFNDDSVQQLGRVISEDVASYS